MISVYNDADYMAAYKQKQKILSIFWIITAVYLVFCAAWLAYYISLPYKDPMQTLPKACVYVASAIYVIVIFPYMAIKYSRVRRYFKMLTYVSEGLKAEEKNYFYCFDEVRLPKDNVDLHACVFETWNKKKCEWMEREACFDVEKTLPDFESGDYVHYIVQNSIMVQYEILQKKALEFEEVDEDYVVETNENGIAEEKDEEKDEEKVEEKAEETENEGTVVEVNEENSAQAFEENQEKTADEERE